MLSLQLETADFFIVKFYSNCNHDFVWYE